LTNNAEYAKIVTSRKTSSILGEKDKKDKNEKNLVTVLCNVYKLLGTSPNS
jgi:hypothetical protein